MTVCISAIYNNNSVIGVSDRMITSGDIEFEPPQSKIIQLTTSIAVMTAGDTNLQTQILLKIISIVREKIAAHPDKWIPVKHVADLYRDCYLELTFNSAEKAILYPYGLTYDKFVARQKEMSDDFIENITYKIQRYSIEDIATIIAGIDDSSGNGPQPHIYSVRNSEISCDDMVGFNSVGIGSNHALSHFMLSGYTRSALDPKVLWTIYQAKKKAEVSPGVGSETDMFVIGPQLGSYVKFDPIPNFNLLKDLDKIYRKNKKRVNRLDKDTEHKIKDYIDKLGSQTAPTQTPSPSLSASVSPSASKSASVSPSVSPSPSEPPPEISRETKGGKKGHKK